MDIMFVQELLAPPSVEFFTREGLWLGVKGLSEIKSTK